ncbi:hypothetical protein MAR_003930 [Mya arenaria]|uniref:Uncharacterized protein n=1 Tax=Mya arenaria TaxID=6604 RepID=A0ABY7EX00_MYAAR|nr:hypothetical protein MAR_003930 [Mya arenaria]
MCVPRHRKLIICDTCGCYRLPLSTRGQGNWEIVTEQGGYCRELLESLVAVIVPDYCPPGLG